MLFQIEIDLSNSFYRELSKLCRLSVDPLTCDSSHTKTFLLIQAHLSHLPLPSSDYLTDTKSVMDQSIRVLQVNIPEKFDKCHNSVWFYVERINNLLMHYIDVISKAMIDICAEKGWLITVIRIQQLMQCVVQGRWYDDSPVLCLPHVEELNIPCFKRIPVKYVKPKEFP